MIPRIFGTLIVFSVLFICHGYGGLEYVDSGAQATPLLRRILASDDLEPPTFTKQLSAKTLVKQKRDIILEVNFESALHEKTVWKKGENELKDVDDTRIKIEKTPVSSKLSVTSAVKGDEGIYKCIISNDDGELSTETALTVADGVPPTLTKRLSPKTTVKEGNDIIMEVTFKDALQEKTVWKRGENELKDGDDIRIKIEKTPVSSKLTITSAVKGDEGIYRCIISNDDGEISTETELTLKDLIRPKFTKPLQPTTEVPIGQNIFLEVSFTYAESHRTKWTRDGKEIKEDGVRIKIETSEGVSRLTITSADVVDAGTYECIISSVDETVWTTTVLSVFGSNALDCKENPCQNGGQCVIKGGRNDSECICKEGFTGNRCEIEILCRPNPCMNEGRCLIDCKQKKYSCQCTDDYTGTFCETAHVCRSHPCQNGGTCTLDKETKSYACLCPDGYVGRNCEVEVVCSPNPCLNGGRCVLDCDSGQYACLCSEDYTGKHCEAPMTPVNYLRKLSED